MKAIPTKVVPDLLGRMVRPIAVRLRRVDGSPVELSEPRLAAELVPHVYRPGLPLLLGA